MSNNVLFKIILSCKEEVKGSSPYPKELFTPPKLFCQLLFETLIKLYNL